MHQRLIHQTLRDAKGMPQFKATHPLISLKYIRICSFKSFLTHITDTSHRQSLNKGNYFLSSTSLGKSSALVHILCKICLPVRKFDSLEKKSSIMIAMYYFLLGFANQ